MAAAVIVIATNVPEVVRQFGRLQREQLPFATSLALNAVGRTAREAQTSGILERFIVRRRQRLSTSVQMKASSKRDLQVMLTVRDTFLVQHERGELRRPGDIASSIVRPVAPRARAVGVIRGRNTPQAVLRQGGFAARTRSGRVGIYRRQRVAAPELVFVLEPSVQLTPRLRFEETVRGVLERDWEQAFDASLARALRGAR